MWSAENVYPGRLTEQSPTPAPHRRIVSQPCKEATPLPSNTFFNLPDSKREKLLAAARAEFARVPYPQASINQIIRGAGISRGSFYTYFRDKGELFSFFLDKCVYSALDLIKEMAQRTRGDLFICFPAIFDYALEAAQSPDSRAAYEDLLQILEQNGPGLISSFLEQATPTVLSALKDAADVSRFDLRTEGDLEDCLRVLTALTAGALKEALFSTDPAAVRRRLINTLDILARGMASKPLN